MGDWARATWFCRLAARAARATPTRMMPAVTAVMTMGMETLRRLGWLGVGSGVRGMADLSMIET